MDALIELERARLAAIPPEWEDVVSGRVSVADAEQRIRARGDVDERELARARELFAPLSADFEAGLVERLIPTAPVPISTHTPVVDRRDPAWWRRPAVLAATAAAAAAAFALVWARPGSTPSPADAPAVAGPAVPGHELILVGVADVRGSETKVAVPPGGTLQVSLRPATRYAFTPTVWACLGQAGDAKPIAITTEPGAPGTTIGAQVTVPGDLAAGEWQLSTFVASRPVPESQRSCATPTTSDVLVRRQTFQVTPPR